MNRDDARIGAAVLAAGQASRFGSQKLLAMVDGEPLVSVSVKRLLAEPFASIVVVCGHQGREVGRVVAARRVRTVLNPRHAEGMGTSIAAAVGALAQDGVDAVLITLGDQPISNPEIVPALIEAYRTSQAWIVAPVYDGTRGNPVLFDQALFDALRSFDGDRGASELIDEHGSRVHLVEFPFAAPPDIDTPADLSLLAEPEAIRPA